MLHLMFINEKLLIYLHLNINLRILRVKNIIILLEHPVCKIINTVFFPDPRMSDTRLRHIIKFYFSPRLHLSETSS